MTIASGWVTGFPLGDVAVSLGDLSFDTDMSSSVWDRDGWTIGLAAIEGWDDSAPDASESIDHPSGDGRLSGLEQDAARVIRLLGSVSATSPRTLAEAKDALKRARGLLMVNERPRGLAREATVSRPRIVWDREHPTFERFTATMVADDPLRYSTASVALVNGPNTLINRGDRAASPVLELVGPHPEITVQHPGGTWKLAEIGAGWTRVHDVRNGDVWLGDTRLFGRESGPVPAIAPGGSSWTVSGLGAGTARVRRFEAWS